MTLDYLVKNKPELYNNLLSGSNGQSAFDPNGDGVHEVSPLVVDFLDLTKVEGQSFRDNLKDWSNSKVYLNLLKWKQYNNIFNTMSLQRYQFWTRKVNDLNKHRKLEKILGFLGFFDFFGFFLIFWIFLDFLYFFGFLYFFIFFWVSFDVFHIFSNFLA